MIKQFLILNIVILLSCLTAFGQNNKGIKLGGGLSYISSKIDSKLIPNSTQKFYWRPSVQGGYFYNYHFREKSSIGAELLFVRINGKEITETKIFDQHGNPTGQLIVSTQSRHISYLGIPLYYEYKIKKLSMNMGVQFSFIIYGKFKADVEAPIPINYSAQPFISMGIKHYDFGARYGVTYSLTKKMAVETTFYYGLNDISNKTTETFGYPDVKEKKHSDLIWKVRQIAFSLRYKL